MHLDRAKAVRIQLGMSNIGKDYRILSSLNAFIGSKKSIGTVKFWDFESNQIYDRNFDILKLSLPKGKLLDISA